MGSDPNNRRDEAAHRSRMGRWAWLPIPVLLAALGVFWGAGWQESHESIHLLLTLNIVFSLLVCLVMAYLIARSFLVRGAPGLLLLGCGVAVWGPAGVVATAAARGDTNLSITIYNSCLWLSGLCHLAGASLSLRPRRALSPAALWLLAGYVGAAGAVALIALAALAGWIPAFFVEPRGGTPARQAVLVSATAMFALTALLTVVTRRDSICGFAYWYTLALLLIAVGLLGVALQSYHASILGWTGRGAQALGGFYLLVAAVVSVRESRVWGISLEGALRENQALMNAVMEGSPDLIYVKDLQGRVLMANPAACRALGRPIHQVIGRTALEFHRGQPEMARALMENDRRVMESGATQIIEEVGGQGRIYLSTKAPYRDAAGNIIGLIGISHDITERKQAEESLRDANENLCVQAEQLRTLNDMLEVHQKELQAANEDLRAQEEELRYQAEALRESEERYRTLFETAPDAIVVHRDGRFLLANDAALRLTGARSFAELAQHTILDFSRPEEHDRALERTRRAMAGQRLPTCEAALQRLDGGEVAVELHTVPVDFHGERAVQTIIRDIAERKRAEESLRELNAVLERKVAERTAELERRARQLQKLTLELSQAHERERKRVAEILHEDLQQQIAGAKFQLNLLSSRSHDDSARQWTAAQINQILKDAIRMSRSLSHELSPAVFYGNDLGEALDWLGEQMEARHGVAIHVEVPGDGTLQSEAVTVFLFRAARELLSNAVRHAGAPEVAVRLRRMGRYAGLRVSDRGCGFDLQDLKETSGIGLLSIWERVDLLGGRVKIASAKGRGTKVRIVVPDEHPDQDTPM